MPKTTEVRTKPGKSVLVLGPSGSGKSHLLLTAAQAEKGAVLALAQGADEIESYRDLYEDADFLITQKDLESLVEIDDKGVARLVAEKPYLIATFDDEDFFPSQGSWKATGHTNLIQFLRLVRARVQQGDAPWKMLGLDTFSGVGELANNAMCSTMKIEVPPKARGDGGAQYYLGYKSKLQEVARACRAIRGFGLHWLATSHVQIKEASDTATAKDVTAKEQQMAMFTGAFRESVPGHFDLVIYTGIDKDGKHYAQWTPDIFRNAKSRYHMDEKALDSKGRINNDWPTISKAIK